MNFWGASYTHFIWIGLKRQFTKVRWYVFLIVCPVLFYQEANRFIIQLNNMGIQQHVLNIWDILFDLFSYSYIFIFMIPFFLFLVSDLMFDQDSKEQWMLRIGSRTGWWFGKVVILALLTLCYVFFLMAYAYLIGFLYLPWDEGWSVAKVQHLFPLPVQPQIIGSMAPSIVLFQIGCLLYFGLFTFGLITFIASMYTRSEVWGLIISSCIPFLGYVLLLFRIPLVESAFLFPRHFVYHLLDINDLFSSWSQVGISIGYWMVVAVLLWIWGSVKISKEDINLGVAE
ncbi:hypothetical protein CLV36_11453 [Laceyella sediminis]|uniref:ABC-2 type transport system permease protein n=1 Tax=Laceyella sediminis TaxID=573074 RepID=A0ABX5ELL4_9BACL|nr:hypothetical protein [Laceyella sediminis]PRZ12389.1 hypothetical protein CLV36_11453 [Laceyella sediminis]